MRCHSRIFLFLPTHVEGDEDVAIGSLYTTDLDFLIGAALENSQN